jgi:antitoxin StbD
MNRIFAKTVCTMTELREPQKVFDRANGEPVAIFKNSKIVGYLVPETMVQDEEPRHATMDEVEAYLERSRGRTQPVLDYLKDK